jgi:hypothetical protein
MQTHRGGKNLERLWKNEPSINSLNHEHTGIVFHPGQPGAGGFLPVFSLVAAEGYLLCGKTHCLAGRNSYGVDVSVVGPVKLDSAE